MSNKETKYWKGIEELSEDPKFLEQAAKEFPEYLPISDAYGDQSVPGEASSSRRDFLKLMGFGVAAASLAACETPVRKAIPYLNKPESIEPSIANWYASSYIDGSDYCSVLVKTREGRPIKIEGNKLSEVTHGGTSIRAQASVLTLYDNARYKGPLKSGKSVDWKEADNSITTKLKAVSEKGTPIRIVTSSMAGPTVKKALEEFIAVYPTAELVSYDPDSCAALTEAHKTVFGKKGFPAYSFEKTATIVSFGADFLSSWGNHIENTRLYARGRKLSKEKKTMSRHYQFETTMSLTGANADYRIPVKPSQEGLYIAALYNEIASVKGAKILDTARISDLKMIKKAAGELLKNEGESVVVCGSNDVSVQLLVIEINRLLGNYGKTIDISSPYYLKPGDDKKMASFVSDLTAGKLGAVIFWSANPVYDYPAGKDIKKALSQIDLSVSLSTNPDETAAACEYICPDHHYLEAWNDAEPRQGHFSISQPVISPLFKTRQAFESLLKWTGNNTNSHDYLKENWEKTIFPLSDGLLFNRFWSKSLHDGVFKAKKMENNQSVTANPVNLAAVEASVKRNYSLKDKGIELAVYQKAGIGTGRQANNPWLQELSDAITKACWDNYLTIPQSMAAEKGWKQGDIVKVSVKGAEAIEIPVLVQPGQAKGTVGIAVGYGRTTAGKCAEGVGQNAFPLMSLSNDGYIRSSAFDIQIEKTGKTHNIAQTQTHHTIMGRDIVQGATLSAYQKDAKAGRSFPKIATADGQKKKPSELSIWQTEHMHPNHHWGMSIDLNSCLGCGACTVSCRAENNVPIVGREEVLNRREMDWIRIDRYYSSDADEHDLKALENAAENPEVTFQPMLCQHCNSAPCETVCPVAATTHSSEGLNQMTYNRCVGTRYCANNCPYKVRRFNWFRYYRNEKFADVNTPGNNDLSRMVLNPDVTVRARGVMEKCTMCVQRIQEGKLKAKKAGRKVEDEDVQTACSQSCPAEAIVFGDMNNPKSKISKVLNEENTDRTYHILEELNIRPNVSYLTKIKNKDE